MNSTIRARVGASQGHDRGETAYDSAGGEIIHTAGGGAAGFDFPPGKVVPLGVFPHGNQLIGILS